MKTLPLNPRSERGVALIIVLLLLAVMSGLATGMAINSQVEVAMSSNEMYYAGARAAAEAGLNRAVTAILDTTNLLNSNGGCPGATPACCTTPKTCCTATTMLRVPPMTATSVS